MAANREAVFEPLRQREVGVVRLAIEWRYVEVRDYLSVPELHEPEYHWTGVDPIVSDIANKGFRPIVVTYGNPTGPAQWPAATNDCGPIDLVPLSRYGQFIRAMVERYDGDGIDDAPGSPRVPYWEIGNEPDFIRAVGQSRGEQDYGSCFGGGDADDYGEMLREAYLAAKAADPSALVVFGGVAHDRLYNQSWYSPAGPFDYHFVGDVLEHLYSTYPDGSGLPFFDLLGVHTYNDFRDNWDGPNRPFDQDILGKLKNVRDVQLRFSASRPSSGPGPTPTPSNIDLRSMPIAITEAGISSMPSDSFTVRTEGTQSWYPGQLAARTMVAGADMVVWFSATDHKTGACSNLYAWLATGLMRSRAVYDALQTCGPPTWGEDYAVVDAYEPKPAADAAKVASDQLAAATWIRQLSRTEVGCSSTQTKCGREVHIFRDDGAPAGRFLVAFVDRGVRIGQGSFALPRTATIPVSAAILSGWTGAIEITDNLGGVTTKVENGPGIPIAVTISEAPSYIRPVAPP